MRKRLIYVNILILLISFLLCISISVLFGYRSAIDSSERYISNYTKIVADEYGNGTDYESLFSFINNIDKKMRITIVEVTDGNVNVLDSFGSAEADVLENEEFKKLDKMIIRDDRSQKEKMIFYCVIVDDTYIRLGLPYFEQVENVTSMLMIMTICSVAIFILMIFIINRLVTREIKPLNAVISGLESVVGSENTYNYDSLSDISLKIEEVKDQFVKTMDEIISEKDKVSFILDNVGQGILVINSNYEIVICNEVASNIIGINEDKDGNLFDVVKLDNLKEILRKVFIHKSYRVEYTQNDRDYSLWMNKIQAKWLVQNGDDRGILIVFTDITEEKIAERKQKEFFANASHELRSPLTSIIGFQDMICSGIFEGDEIYDAANKTLIEGRKMLELVNNMLDLSALESMQKPEKIEHVNIKTMAEQIIDSLKPQMYAKNISLEVFMQDDAYLDVNVNHLNMIIRNVIDNAIKYNKDNGTISVSLFAGQRATLVVKDTGIGMDDESKKKIFERFYRVDKAHSRKLGSSGLGLPIVKQICNIYGYDISVESEEGKGTEIVIMF